MTDAEHAERTERSFSQQAGSFEDARWGRVLTTESEWVFAGLRRTPLDLVLDVAAGTGIATRGLAPHVRAVIALDATEAMLETGWAEAERANLRNVVFMRGDASALPFLDGSFDTVVCRYAVHHFTDPERPVAEMARVLRSYGVAGIADLVTSEHPDAAAAHNELERLRDPSHVRALSASELQALLVRHGLEATSAETTEVRRELEPWLAQTDTPAAARTEIEHRLQAEIEGEQVTSLRPRREPDGTLSFVHTLTSVTAIRPPGSTAPS